MSRLRRSPLGRGDRGQASVELALLLPVILLLLLAVLQVGVLARDVVLVTHASREAVRAAATDPDPAAAHQAAAGSSGLDADRLTITVGPRGLPGDRVRVEVAYRARTTVPLIGRLVGDRTIRSAATMRVETPPNRSRSPAVGPLRVFSALEVPWKDHPAPPSFAAPALSDARAAGYRPRSGSGLRDR